MASTDTIQALLQAASKRIVASDGMAITADVWAESHDFHRVMQQLHLQHAHAPGILAGLEVCETDAPTEKVVVLPGAALDDQGHLIVLHEPHKIDISLSNGAWPRLMLTYDESDVPQPDTSAQRAELNVKHILHRNKLTLENADAGRGQVELARIRVHKGDADMKVRDARNPQQPGLYEIDTRFRVVLPLSGKAPASIAVVGVGAEADIQGVYTLAAGLSRTRAVCVGVDALPDQAALQNDALKENLNDYTLLVLQVHDLTQMTSALNEALHDYVLTHKGTVWAEAMRGQQQMAALRDLFNSLALPLSPLTADHELMHMPNVFALPPPIDESGNTPPVFVGNGVVLCPGSYSRAWQGQLGNGPASRQAIRDASEFGENGLAFALRRKGFEL
jgi:hypothetical protein